PSRVVISAPATVPIGVTHERTARPRTMTVHAPHWPRPQPSFGPLSPRSSLSTYSSGVAGSTSRRCERPFTFNAISLIWHLPPVNGLSIYLRACRLRIADSWRRLPLLSRRARGTSQTQPTTLRTHQPPLTK